MLATVRLELGPSIVPCSPRFIRMHRHPHLSSVGVWTAVLRTGVLHRSPGARGEVRCGLHLARAACPVGGRHPRYALLVYRRWNGPRPGGAIATRLDPDRNPLAPIKQAVAVRWLDRSHDVRQPISTSCSRSDTSRSRSEVHPDAPGVSAELSTGERESFSLRPRRRSPGGALFSSVPYLVVADHVPE